MKNTMLKQLLSFMMVLAIVMSYMVIPVGATEADDQLDIPDCTHEGKTLMESLSATCVADGSNTYHCGNCGNDIVEPISATGVHGYENGICTVCSGADPNYVAPTNEESTTPVCNCADAAKCVAGAVKTECAVCSAEGAVLAECCLGRAEETSPETGTPGPVCICSDEGKCVEGAVKTECAVCSAEGAVLAECCLGKAEETSPEKVTLGPVCVCGDAAKCAEGAVKAECAACSAEGAVLAECCLGRAEENSPEEVAPDPVCVCGDAAKCAEGAVKTECTVCSAQDADLTICCLGKTEENTSDLKCTCVEYCSENAVETCEACKADLANCQPLTCTCQGEEKCVADAVKAECPICSAEGADLTTCCLGETVTVAMPKALYFSDQDKTWGSEVKVVYADAEGNTTEVPLSYSERDYFYSGEVPAGTVSFYFTDGVYQTQCRSVEAVLSDYCDMCVLFDGEEEWMEFELWAQRVTNEWYDASATELIIRSAEEMWEFATIVNDGTGDFVGKTVKLAGPINLAGEAWTPIGNSDRPFRGVFDGGEYEISNMTINNNSDNQGLFGVVTNGAVIKNVVIDDSCKIETGNPAKYTGAVVGCINGSGSVTIENCINNAAVSGYQYVGGIVGGTTNSVQVTIQQCSNMADIVGNLQNAAGIVGCVQSGSNRVTVTDCYNAGKISGGKENGAISGWLGTDAVAENCLNIGTVENGQSGRCFTRYNSITMTNCYQLSGLAAQTGVKEVTAEDISSGKAATLLGGTWGQNLTAGTSLMPGTADEYPVYTVYQADSCIVDRYTNTNENSEPKHDESYEAVGKCLVCGLITPDSIYANGLDLTTKTENDSGPGWAWDHAAKTLTLTDFAIATDNEFAIKLPTDSKVILNGKNELTSGNLNAKGIWCEGTLTIQGNEGSSLNVAVTSGYAICCANAAGNAGLILDGANIETTGGMIAVDSQNSTFRMNGSKLKTHPSAITVKSSENGNTVFEVINSDLNAGIVTVENANASKTSTDQVTFRVSGSTWYTQCSGANVNTIEITCHTLDMDIANTQMTLWNSGYGSNWGHAYGMRVNGKGTSYINFSDSNFMLYGMHTSIWADALIDVAESSCIDNCEIVSFAKKAGGALEFLENDTNNDRYGETNVTQQLYKDTIVIECSNMESEGNQEVIANIVGNPVITSDFELPKSIGSVSDITQYAEPFVLAEGQTITVSDGVTMAFPEGIEVVLSKGASIQGDLYGTIVPAENVILVTFVYDENNKNTISIEAGTAVSAPEANEKIVGWYTEETYENPFDFDTVLIQNTTLYAKWEVEDSTVEVGGSQIAVPGDSEITENGNGDTVIVPGDDDNDEPGTDIIVNGTDVTVPEGGAIVVDKETGEVTVPGGSEITIPGGESTDPDITIDVPENGEATINPDGSVDVSENTDVTIGGTTVTLPEGGTVNPDGTIEIPEGGSITVGDHTIELPEGGTVKVDEDGNITLPDGGTVEIGGVEAEVPAGSTVDPTTGTITLPTGGGTVNVGGTDIELPGSSTITPDEDGSGVAIDPNETDDTVKVGGNTVTIPESSEIEVDANGNVTFPENSTIETKDGTKVTLPDGGTLRIKPDGSIVATPDENGGNAYGRVIVEDGEGKKTTYFVPKGDSLILDKDGKLSTSGKEGYLTDKNGDGKPDIRMTDWTNHPNKAIYRKGTGKTLTFACNGFLNSLDYVEVWSTENNYHKKLVEGTDYTKTRGSTVIELKNSYLRKLPTGTYTITLTYKDGQDVDGTFYVQNIWNWMDNPRTGDYIMIAVGVMTISAAALVILLVFKKKKK